eukprot:TRINITY_DN711_c3_g1_i1.p1 TRINITY_DN711_c3_g1~~TRINITY_DN711_c3_g1_i1.p1  ORF type:complete len:488 (+),score=86.06 TRINITY_DN711_c3_g1_i1:62-1465(+)
MAHRLDTIISHLKNGRSAEVEKLKVVYDLKSDFDLSTAKLNQIIVHFIGEMVGGLEGKESAFKMLPSFVYRGETSVSGSFLALDLGGTNFRIIHLHLDNGKVTNETVVKYQIPPKLMLKDYAAEELFGFIATCVDSFLKDNPEGRGAPLGFTFSFPVDQCDIDSGKLITWTKGFATRGCEGKDVVQLLQDALKKQNVDVDVCALVNDTVGTLVTGYFAQQQAKIGCIIGTGSNACYWEDVPQIKKMPSPSGWSGDQQMCINIEWGNFDSKKQCVLPFTEMDNAIDAASPNVGAQRFEKMISGMYIGEICRLCLIHLVRHSVLPSVPCIVKPGSLETRHVSEIIGDSSPDLSSIKALLAGLYQYSLQTEQAALVKDVFLAVTTRSARLSATGIAAILLKTGSLSGSRVCIDGSVFEKTPYYKETMEQCLDELLSAHGHSSHGTVLELTGSGSGVGAALIAALTKASRQ